MMEDAHASQTEDPAAPPSSNSDSDSGSTLECPICYQEYNQDNRCPYMLDCLHSFCTECLQWIQLLCEPVDTSRSLAIPCPLCHCQTPLDALSLSCKFRILSGLPQVDYLMPAANAASRLATQRVGRSLEGINRDSHFITLPTVSLPVQQMHQDRLFDEAPGLVGEQGVEQVDL